MALEAKLDQCIKCPSCDSEWFTEITYHRYSASGYGSLESWTIEAMPQPLRVCLCGRPFKPSPQMRAGRTPNAELQSFRESMELAGKRPHGGRQASEELHLLAQQVGTRQEAERLRIEIAALRDENTSLRDQLASLRDQFDRLTRQLGVDLSTKTEAVPRLEEGRVEG